MTSSEQREGQGTTGASPRSHLQPWLGCLLLLVACSKSRDPDLDALRPDAPRSAPETETSSSLRLTVPLGSAPAGETGRSVAAARRVVVLAGEPAILEALGARLEEAFERDAPDHDLRLRPAASRTAVGLALTGQADVALLLDALSPGERGRGMEHSEVGRWTLALYAHPDLPLRQLTRTQVRELFTGRVREWSLVGGGRGEVRLVLPAPGPAAEFAARFLAPGEGFEKDALRAADPASTMHLLRSTPGSIGVLPLPVVDERPGLRQVGVEGSLPGLSPGWPYAPAVCLATAGPVTEPAKTLERVLRTLLAAQ